jgi:hypothetical protein
MNYGIFSKPPRIQARNPAVEEYTGAAKHILGFSGKQHALGVAEERVIAQFYGMAAYDHGVGAPPTFP